MPKNKTSLKLTNGQVRNFLKLKIENGMEQEKEAHDFSSETKMKIRPEI